MSTQYDEVVRILHEDYEWSPFCSPAPIATEKALETQTPSEVASALDAYVFRVLESSHFYPSHDQAAYSLFSTGKEYWEHGTAIALGQQVETPVENIGRAVTVDEWLSHMAHGYTRQGYKDTNCAPWTKQGQLRREAVKVVPPAFLGYERIWELAVLSGYFQVGLTGFEIAYATKSPRLSEIRGLDASKWMENLTYIDLHPGDLAGIPWPPQKPVKK